MDTAGGVEGNKIINNICSNNKSLLSLKLNKQKGNNRIKKANAISFTLRIFKGYIE